MFYFSNKISFENTDSLKINWIGINQNQVDGLEFIYYNLKENIVSISSSHLNSGTLCGLQGDAPRASRCQVLHISTEESLGTEMSVCPLATVSALTALSAPCHHNKWGLCITDLSILLYFFGRHMVAGSDGCADSFADTFVCSSVVEASAGGSFQSRSCVILSHPLKIWEILSCSIPNLSRFVLLVPHIPAGER